ncbi:ARL14 effector protein-like [Haliotis rubra]|uniref:ARL14 effector protein-like n=1 Tax=Haliotis rubra TaxID=36100 RepID=UPI001EE5E715|nr:ARL14 effector protein-like [Haliotis rubra]
MESMMTNKVKSSNEHLFRVQESAAVNGKQGLQTANEKKGNNSSRTEPRRSSRLEIAGVKNVECELKKLSFENPGKFMEDFHPESSGREMRKMNRKFYKENVRKNQLYDEAGILLENNKDLCDCLDVHCPGCHFPCPKCGSEKCGTDCRCNRKWTYEHINVEGTNVLFKWPT